MKLSELKRLPDLCGFISTIQEVETHSTVGRKLLWESDFMTDAKAIEDEFKTTQYLIEIISQPSHKRDLSALQMQFGDIRDILNTLLKLSANDTLNDIELFEIKHFAFSAKRTFELIQQLTNNTLIDNICFYEDIFDKVIKILDPENSGVSTFYIYGAYSQTLVRLRREEAAYSEDPNLLALTQAKIVEVEQEIRVSLSNRLTIYSQSLIDAINTIAYTDLLFAKAEYAMRLNLCLPKISTDKTEYLGLFNPEIKEKIEEREGKYQCIDITFGDYPTLITGINMGGKTLMLKTLYLSQMLFQYGFFVPAQKAHIMVVDEIMLSFTDEQNQAQGLSSFAAEMRQISQIINEISDHKKHLILIDELARTTNPKEGAAIVSSMLEILQEHNVSSFITTHYDITTSCRRLRVKGLKDDFKQNHLLNIVQSNNHKKIAPMENVKFLLKNIDYQLIDDMSDQTPNEAIRIAEMLGVNQQLISKAKNKLKK